MAGIFTSYEVDNDKRFERQLENAIKLIGDVSAPLGEISRDFFRSQKAVFNNAPGLYPDYVDTKTGTTGRDTPYAKRKLRLYGRVYPMLVASGKLRDSLTEPTAPNADTVLSIGKKTLVLGTKVKNDKGVYYPVFHQSDKPRKKMPLRKFLFIGPEARRYAPSETVGRPERWKMILEKWTEAKLKQNRAKYAK